MASKDDNKTVFDVSKPGSTPPDASSKPIIVTHKPMMKDPMVNGEKELSEMDAAVNTEGIKAPSEKSEGSSKVIAPLTDTKNDEEIKTEDPVNENLPANDKEEKTQEEAVIDAVISKSEDKKKKHIAEEQQIAKREKIKKLVESKKYFVKVRPAKAKRNKRTLLTILLLMAISFVGVGLAADAELIDLNVPFDFIKKSEPNKSQAVILSAEPKDENGEPSNGDADVEQTNKSVTKTFSSDELGLSFDYPTSMTPVVTETGSEFTSSGFAYLLSLREKLLGHAFSADWQPASDVDVKGEYNGCVSGDATTKVTVVFYEAQDYCVSGYDYIDYSVDTTGSVAAVVTMQKKISTPKGIVLLEITSQPIGSENNIDIAEEIIMSSFKETAAELELIAKSVKSL